MESFSRGEVEIVEKPHKNLINNRVGAAAVARLGMTATVKIIVRGEILADSLLKEK